MNSEGKKRARVIYNPGYELKLYICSTTEGYGDL